MSVEKFRILHLSTWNVPCGIASYCANFISGLNSHGVENDVFAFRPHEWRTMLSNDIDHLFSDIERQARNFDLVHIQHEHSFFGATRGGPFAVNCFGELLRRLRKQKTPVVTTFHTEYPAANVSGPRLIRKIKNWQQQFHLRNRVASHFSSDQGMARAIVHSAQTRCAFARDGFDERAVHVVPHACLPVRQAATDREQAKERLGIPPHACLLTIFGFVGKYKGHDIALEALKYLPERFHLAVVGGTHPEARNDFFNEILSRVNQSLRSRVVVTGYVSRETASLYFDATDICLAPYRANVLLSGSGAITWALSSCRPVIASKIEAFEDIQRTGDCLMMVTPEMIHELAWAVEKLEVDQTLQETLVAKARTYVEQHSWSQIAADTIAIYEQMLGRKAGEHRLVLPQVA